jgi:hypothetical protein
MAEGSRQGSAKITGAGGAHGARGRIALTGEGRRCAADIDALAGDGRTVPRLAFRSVNVAAEE